MEDTGYNSNFLVCKTLELKQRCFRVRLYNDGEYEEIFHEHIPYNRMSKDNAVDFMRALIVKHSGWLDTHILKLYVNRRRGEPYRSNDIRIHHESVTPEISRVYCTALHIEVMMDVKFEYK